MAIVQLVGLGMRDWHDGNGQRGQERELIRQPRAVSRQADIAYMCQQLQPAERQSRDPSPIKIWLISEEIRKSDLPSPGQQRREQRQTEQLSSGEGMHEYH